MSQHHPNPSTASPNFWASSFVLILLSAAILLGFYFAAPHLPVWAGWENGPVENTQVVILLIGGVLAIRQALRHNSQPQRCFWWVISPIWFVMALRELSWGATLLAPLEVSAITGPAFSSSQQLFYKPAITPIIAGLLIIMAIAALRWRIDRLLPHLWRTRTLPLVEIFLVVVSMLVSTAAEGHMGMSITSLGEAASQNLEELAEFWAYLMLLMAQIRVARGLQIPATTTTRI